MKQSRFTEEQIIAVLREHQAAAKTGDLARRHGSLERIVVWESGNIAEDGSVAGNYDTAVACSTVCGAPRLDGSPTRQPWTTEPESPSLSPQSQWGYHLLRYAPAATPVPTVQTSKSSHQPSTIAAARAALQRGASVHAHTAIVRYRWNIRGLLETFHGELDGRVFAPPLPNDAFQRRTAVAEIPADQSS